jgi:hypothetical protein
MDYDAFDGMDALGVLIFMTARWDSYLAIFNTYYRGTSWDLDNPEEKAKYWEYNRIGWVLWLYRKYGKNWLTA